MLLGVKLTKVWGDFSKDYLSLEFFSLQLVHTEPPTTHPLEFRFSYLALPTEVSALVTCDSLYLLVCFSPMSGIAVCPLLSILQWMEEELLVFNLFSFFVVGTGVITSKLLTCRIQAHVSKAAFSCSASFKTRI